MHPLSPTLSLHVFAALWAQDVITFGEEPTTDQGHGALLAVKAVVVPLALLKGNVLAASEAWKRESSVSRDIRETEEVIFRSRKETDN